MRYISFMPFMASECVEIATSTVENYISTTTCSFTQVAPFAVVDWPLVLGLSFLLAFTAATYIRNVFYR